MDVGTKTRTIERTELFTDKPLKKPKSEHPLRDVGMDQLRKALSVSNFDLLSTPAVAEPVVIPTPVLAAPLQPNPPVLQHPNGFLPSVMSTTQQSPSQFLHTPTSGQIPPTGYPHSFPMVPPQLTDIQFAMSQSNLFVAQLATQNGFPLVPAVYEKFLRDIQSGSRQMQSMMTTMAQEPPFKRRKSRVLPKKSTQTAEAPALPAEESETPKRKTAKQPTPLINSKTPKRAKKEVESTPVSAKKKAEDPVEYSIPPWMDDEPESVAGSEEEVNEKDEDYLPSE